MLITAIFALCGWMLDIQVFKSICKAFPCMKVNTAIGFILLTTAYLSLLYNKKSAKLIRYSNLVPIFYIAIISLVENFLHRNFSADDFFVPFYNIVDLKKQLPQTIPVVASACFLLSSVWIILAGTTSNKAHIAGQYLLHITTLISGSALFGYLYGQSFLSDFGMGIHISLQSTTCFFLFSIIASLLHHKLGITGIFIGNKSGNIMARKLFIRFLLAIIAIGYGEVLIHHSKIILPGLGSTLLTVLLILMALYFIRIVSKQLNTVEEKKDFAYHNLSLGIEAAPYALIIADKDGIIQHVNTETEKLYQYSRHEIVGKSMALLQPDGVDILNGELRATFFEHGNLIRLGNESNQYVQQKNGHRFPAEITFRPFTSMYGPCILMCVLDLTDVKQKELIISEQLQELHYKNNELEQFNYIASHDLQEPLRTVTNYISLLSEDYPEIIGGSGIADHLAVMSSATERMSTLIRSLLDFGRLGRNRKLSPVNCLTVINDVRADLKNLINNSSASIMVDTPMPELYGYETELRQLFQNLLNNAIKFRKHDMNPLINIGCVKTDNSYNFYISDNGIGIESKYFEDIFNIFQRIHPISTYEGYGVGLANCKKVAEMHGGKIWVESTPGEGSTFWFSILHLKMYDEVFQVA